MVPSSQPEVIISVVIPMYNAEALIERCLSPLLAMARDGEIAEIIIIDDGSTDGSADVVRNIDGVRLVRDGSRGGPGAARNQGAKIARGSYLWFVDSDVIVADDAGRVLLEVLRNERPAAVIGSYDQAPAAQNFLSRYKNLVHHFYHHKAKRQASTFWSGCGAVDRELFLSLDGFDAQRYPYPSIEDIELGYRIIDSGGSIILEKRMQGKHLKEWRFVNLIHTEIFRRALPWSTLMLERKHISNDLNVGKAERVRAVLAGAGALTLFAWLFGWIGAGLVVVALLVLAWANKDIISFFKRNGGPLFALAGFLFHQLYYLYSSASFAAATAQHHVSRLTGKR